MLIKCGECGREISDQAAACPGCGAPVSKSGTEGPVSDIQTIEQTSKGWKVTQLAGVGLIVLGMIVAAGGGGAAAGVFFLIGLVVLIYGRAGAWWENG